MGAAGRWLLGIVIRSRRDGYGGGVLKQFLRAASSSPSPSPSSLVPHLPSTPPQQQQQQRPLDGVALRNKPQQDNIIVSGYDAWWREWQEQRPLLPSLDVEDILASEGTVVMDANIGAIFARLTLEKPAPDRQVFLGMLRSLVERGRLNAPPKLMHRYAVANNRHFKICIPSTYIEEGDRNCIGHMGEELMQCILDAKYELPRDHVKSMDFLITLLQCAFLYPSTIILTNNKDYYFLLKAAREQQHCLQSSYPDYATRIDLNTIRIVYVMEQLKLNVYQVVRV